MDFKVQKLIFKYLQVVIDKGNPKLLPFIITVYNSHCKQYVNDIDCKIAKGQNPQPNSPIFAQKMNDKTQFLAFSINTN